LEGSTRIGLEIVYTQERFLDDLNIRRFDLIETLKTANRQVPQQNFKIDEQIGHRNSTAVEIE